jgi:hypothetical protein
MSEQTNKKKAERALEKAEARSVASMAAFRRRYLPRDAEKAGERKDVESETADVLASAFREALSQ